MLYEGHFIPCGRVIFIFNHQKETVKWRKTTHLPTEACAVEYYTLKENVGKEEERANVKRVWIRKKNKIKFDSWLLIGIFSKNKHLHRRSCFKLILAIIHCFRLQTGIEYANKIFWTTEKMINGCLPIARLTASRKFSFL